MDKEDSDSESKYNYSNKKNEQSPSPVYVEKKVNISLNPNVTNSPKKTNKPIKKVDLGAAANFGKDASSQSLSGVTTTTCKHKQMFFKVEIIKQLLISYSYQFIKWRFRSKGWWN